MMKLMVEIIVFTEIVGVRTVSEKCSQDGLEAINKNVVQTPAFDVNLLNGRGNVYALLDNYMVMRNSNGQFSNRFFK